MRFRVEREALAEALAWVARALPTRPVVPVLSGLRLDAGPGLTLSCFDYEVAATAQIEADVLEPGTVIVPGRLLTEITRSLPALAVDIATDADGVSVTCGSAEFTLVALSAEEYPALPVPPAVAGTVDGGLLGAAIGQVVPAASRDDTLPMLTGVCLDIEDGTLTLAATDRYRLAVRDLSWEPVRDGLRAVALVPARTLADAARAMTPGVPVSISFETGPAGPKAAGSKAAGSKARRVQDGRAQARRGPDQFRDRRPAADRPADRRGIHPLPVTIPQRVRLPGGRARRAVHRGRPPGLPGRGPDQPGPAQLQPRQSRDRSTDRGPGPRRGNRASRIPRRGARSSRSTRTTCSTAWLQPRHQSRLALSPAARKPAARPPPTRTRVRTVRRRPPTPGCSGSSSPARPSPR